MIFRSKSYCVKKYREDEDDPPVGYQYWEMCGRVHREILPAIIYDNCKLYWYTHGQLDSWQFNDI